MKKSLPGRTRASPDDLERVAIEEIAKLLRLGIKRRGLPNEKSPLSPARRSLRSSNSATLHGGALHVALGKLVYSWHRRPPYIDAAGRPRPLSLDGPRPSLMSLVADHVDSAETPELLSALRKQGLIRRSRDGFFRPTATVAQLRANGPEVASYVTDTIARLLDTVLGNIRSGSSQAPLLERAAVVRDLPAHLEAEFVEFATEQGEIFVETINEWLESRRVASAKPDRRKRQPITAGVQVFSFISRPNPSPRPRRAARAAGSSRRSSSAGPV